MENKDVIQEFADTLKITYTEAEAMVGAETVDEVLDNIKKYNENKITENMPKLNRKQRRALAKKMKNKDNAFNNLELKTIADTAKQIDYIDLIQRLQALNKKKEEENKNEATNEDN